MSLDDEASRDALEERYTDLLRLQRGSNAVLDAQVKAGAASVKQADDALAQEIDRLIRREINPDILSSIAKAAWDVPDDTGFDRLAREAEAKIRLDLLSKEHGGPDAFRTAIKKGAEGLSVKEGDLEGLKATIGKLEKQLEPVRKFNQENSAYYHITQKNRAKIEDAGFLGFGGDHDFDQARKVVNRYNNVNGTRRGDYFYSADCFQDMENLRLAQESLPALEQEVALLQDRHLKRLLAYKEMDTAQAVLKEMGDSRDSDPELKKFREVLTQQLLTDKEFLSAFAGHAPSSMGGPLVLAALGAKIRHAIQNDLTGYQGLVQETTKLLEGPIGSVARAVNDPGVIDGVEKDIKAQAVMAGYRCLCNAAALRSLDAFRPEHVEGPASLTKDMRFHMKVQGGVDPAYIQKVCGLDSQLTALFNVNAERPQPDFKGVLSNLDSIRDRDRVYSKFLADMKENPDVVEAGFAAGKIDVLSFEGLLRRYISSGTTDQDKVVLLEEQAEEVDAIREERKKLGINPNGVQIPEI